MKTEKQIAAAAAVFAERWQGRGYERGESQLFWADLLTNVYGVENLPDFIRYEERVSSMVDSTNFIDGHIPSTRVLIEQKSIDKDLRAPVPQSEGGKLTPFQQAKKYVANMPTEAQKAKIEQTAQAILDVRAKFPDCSLADLYDEAAMPPELRQAHQENDRAVMQAYGFPVKSTFQESECVADLFRMYQGMVK